LKILLATHLFFPEHKAGTEVLTLELARSLRERGEKVTVATCVRHADTDDECNPWLTQIDFDGFDVYQLNFGTAKMRDPVSHHFNSPKRIALLLDLISQIKPDVVHFHHIHGFSAAAISETRKTGIPVFFTATDYWSICSRTNLFKPHLQQVCPGPESPQDCLRCSQPKAPAWTANAAMLLANDNTSRFSSTLAQVNSLKRRTHEMAKHINHATRIFGSTDFIVDLLTRYGVQAKLTKVIPYGVRLGELPPAVPIPDYFDRSQPLRIGFIGSLTAIKGAHVLLEALTRLQEEDLARIKVYIYGNHAFDNHYKELLDQHASRLGETVTFKGTFPHEQIGSVLRNIHLCVVPSIWYESAPLVLCSSLAAETPVLVSRMGGMTEIIRESENGFSFTSGNSTELATLLNRILLDSGVLKKVSSGSSHAYRTPSDYAEDIAKAYREALANCGTMEQ